MQNRVKKQTRILAIDYGERRIGLAVSDPLGITAQGLETLSVSCPQDALSKIEQLVKTFRVSEIILGLPVNMDGTRGCRAQEVSGFAERLRKRTGLSVTLSDERLTSVAAHRILHRMGLKIKDKKRDVDRIAAQMLLQDYLEKYSNRGGRDAR
ncbi:MAG: Holliday junction resolvase RuvX [Candidatus Latescibacteria bacterium 4484_181]|nr:MAG: Holliday junction resolvase RuvX [Candidatus Latescibacteria bacterium 4484_181]RKY73661.1 MAG: Holliday junction resolvase RuvX [Candidatus Latescibacterota bacterium]